MESILCENAGGDKNVLSRVTEIPAIIGASEKVLTTFIAWNFRQACRRSSSRNLFIYPPRAIRRQEKMVWRRRRIIYSIALLSFWMHTKVRAPRTGICQHAGGGTLRSRPRTQNK